MRNKIIIITVLLSMIFLKGQIKYGGTIQGQQGKEFIVQLKNISSEEIFSEVTDRNNHFLFNNLSVGKYERCVYYFNEKKCDTIDIAQSGHNNTITIPLEKTIQEVVLSKSKEKPLVEMKNGVISVNIVDNPIMNTNSVFDALTKLPGVSYNLSNNSFSVKGRTGVLIQIDGEAMILPREQVIEYLKALSASDIKNIEINTAPSSQYDASGVAGVINIITKKEKRQGYFTNISWSGTISKYYRQNTNVRLQYNNKKSQYAFRYTNVWGKRFQEAIIKRQFLHTDSEQESYTEIQNKDYVLDFSYLQEFKKSTLLLSALGSFYSEKIEQNTDLIFKKPFQYINAEQNANNKMQNLNINAKYTIDFKNSKTIFRTHFIKYNINRLNHLLSENVDFDNKSPQSLNLLIGQFDHNQTLDSLSSIKIGAKVAFQKMKTMNNFFEKENDVPILNTTKSSDFQHQETLWAGYTEYLRKINNFDITLGLRAEYSPIFSEDIKRKHQLIRKDWEVFPFANVSYQPSKQHLWSFSYGKKIKRPLFKQLMPFTYYVDEYNTLIGNPNLLPHLSHSLDLKYIFNQKYTFGLNYTQDINSIFQTPILNNRDRTTITKPINIDNGYSVSFFNHSNFKLFKKIDMNISTILFYRAIKSIQSNVDSKQWSYNFNINSGYKLKQYNFNIMFYYLSPIIQGPYKTEKILSIDASVSRKFFDNRLQVSIIGNDILGTYKINQHLNNASRMDIQQNINSQWIRLSLNYNFDKGLKKSNIASDKGADDIKNRVQL